MKKIDITYMAYSRLHYDTFDASTPFGEIHDKLRERCNTYHITSVCYTNPNDNKKPVTHDTEVNNLYNTFKKLINKLINL